MLVIKGVFEDSFDHHQMINTSYEKHTRWDTLTKVWVGGLFFGDSFDHHQMTNMCNV
jgi:hypothetical protein